MNIKLKEELLEECISTESSNDDIVKLYKIVCKVKAFDGDKTKIDAQAVDKIITHLVETYDMFISNIIVITPKKTGKMTFSVSVCSWMNRGDLHTFATAHAKTFAELQIKTAVLLILFAKVSKKMRKK